MPVSEVTGDDAERLRHFQLAQDLSAGPAANGRVGPASYGTIANATPHPVGVQFELPPENVVP
jgi:hypothetical protein